jgi:hypothetical protein
VPKRKRKVDLAKSIAAREAVLAAFERAQARYKGATSAKEVANELTVTEKDNLTSWARENLTQYVARILLFAAKRGLIAHSTTLSKIPFYHSPGRQSRVAARPSGPRTRLDEFERYVNAAVKRLQRPVRAADVRTEALRDTQRLSPTEVSVALAKLEKRGKVTVINRGRDVRPGRNLYVPSENWSSGNSSEVPLNWTDKVYRAFLDVWQSAGRNEKPVTPEEVSHRLFGSREGAESVYGPLLNLSRGKKPLLTRVRLPNRTVFYVPIRNRFKAKLLPTPANEWRVLENAVRRAVRQTGKPAVRSSEIQPFFKGAERKQKENIYRLVRRLTKATRTANQIKVIRVGEVGPESFYSLTEDAREGALYLSVCELVRQLNGLRIPAELESIRQCRLRKVAAARASLLSTGLAEIRVQALSMRTPSIRNAETRRIIRKLQHDVDIYLEELAAWRPFPRVAKIDAGITFEELRTLKESIWKPLTASIDQTMVKSLGRHVRRVADEANGERLKKSAVLDRSEALISLGLHYGGPVCRMNAGLAAKELGHVRDECIIIEELRCADVEVRLRAIACLAFLSGVHGVATLSKVTVSDPEHGIRTMAKWAHDFRIAQQPTIAGELNRKNANHEDEFAASKANQVAVAHWLT